MESNFDEDIDYDKIFNTIVKTNIYSYELFYIKTKLEANTVIKCGSYRHRFDKNNFKDEGWYFLKTTTRPCPRGCCTDDTLHLNSIDDLIYDLIHKNKKYEELIEQNRLIIEELNNVK